MNTRLQENLIPSTFFQIEQAKQEWESTADSLSSVVCLLDRHTQILRANRAIESWHLGEVRSVKGRSLHALLHPECRDSGCSLSRFVAQAREQVRHAHTATYDAWDQVLRRDLSVQLRPVFVSRERSSAIVGNLAVGIISDITEQKRAERALLSRDREFRSLLDQIGAAVAIVQQQRLVFVNQAVVDLFGYRLNEVSGLNPVHLFCQHDRNIVRTRLAHFPAPGTALPWEASGVTRAGHERWLHVEQATITWEGQPAIALTIRDETVRHVSEQHLEEEIALLKQHALPFQPDTMHFREAVEAFEKYLLANALRRYDGHQRKTSEMLDIPPKTLYRKMRQYGLKRGD